MPFDNYLPVQLISQLESLLPGLLLILFFVLVVVFVVCVCIHGESTSSCT